MLEKGLIDEDTYKLLVEKINNLNSLLLAGKIDLETYLKLIGDIDELNRLLEEGLIDLDTYNKLLAMIGSNADLVLQDLVGIESTEGVEAIVTDIEAMVRERRGSNRFWIALATMIGSFAIGIKLLLIDAETYKKGTDSASHLTRLYKNKKINEDEFKKAVQTMEMMYRATINKDYTNDKFFRFMNNINDEAALIDRGVIDKNNLSMDVEAINKLTTIYNNGLLTEKYMDLYVNTINSTLSLIKSNMNNESNYNKVVGYLYMKINNFENGDITYEELLDATNMVNDKNIFYFNDVLSKDEYDKFISHISESYVF